MMEPLSCHHLERCPDCMAKVERKEREWSSICLGWNEEIDKLQSRLSLAEAVVEAVKECAAGMVHPDGLELPPARGDWERVMIAIRARDAGREVG